MKEISKSLMDKALVWCASVLGPVESLSDHSKQHGDHESSTCRLRGRDGIYYIKIHETEAHWKNEVHAYEHWAQAFGERAPRLLAVCDGEPHALVISEVPGCIVEDLPLPIERERLVWRAAGAALKPLHEFGTGEFFGPCKRDGTSARQPIRNACEHVRVEFDGWLERAHQAGCLDEDEMKTVAAAMDLIPIFEGEPPVPCHRDYCTANWLVDEDGAWTGVIDFEFAYWDVRVADFSRDPSWAWVRRPDLMDAFFEGYGQPLTDIRQQQLMVARANYALGAIAWGHDNAFYGFEQEGRDALVHLTRLLK